MINLKNKLWILLVLITIVGIGVGIYFFTKNNNKTNQSYTASKSSVNEQNYVGMIEYKKQNFFVSILKKFLDLLKKNK